MGEILGAVILNTDQQTLNPTFQVKHLKVHATGLTSKDGQIIIANEQKKSVRVLKKFNHVSCYDVFADHLASDKQSAVIGSFSEQTRNWRTQHTRTGSKILREW